MGWALKRRQDTGWWNVRSLLMNGWTAARLEVARRDDDLLIAYASLSGAAATSGNFLTLPPGWVTPASMTQIPTPTGMARLYVSAGRTMELPTAIPVSGVAMLVSVPLLDPAMPTVMPGVKV